MRASINVRVWTMTLMLLSSLALAQPSALGVKADPLRQAFYGDLHLHTGYSFDANLSGTRLGPEEAYRFARGDTVTISGVAYRRTTAPLDFMAVTDHSEWMNVPEAWESPKSPPFMKELHRKYSVALKESVETYLKLGWPSSPERPMGADMQAAARAAWQRQIEAANRYYRPGEFTTLLGYEWTSQDLVEGDVVGLHRTVIFGGGDPPAPFTSIDSNDPEALWKYLEQCRKQGHEALAIAAHPHRSRGKMFDGLDSEGRPIDKAYAEARAASELLLEITQSSGASEADPELSPDDEFAGFDLPNRPTRKRPERGSYARYALSDGMRFAQGHGGVNPYRFGFVGTSDFHNGRSESAEGAKAHQSSGSLTGVWAERNTREAIFAALRRRETFATSGTRLKLRFFGGWSFDRSILNDRDWLQAAYRDGVPMGGDLPAPPAVKRAPVFIVQADKDVNGANLDRVQIVKIWLEGGQHAEKVYDVALSDQRVIDGRTGRVPAVGDTVNPAMATYTNTIGSPTLAAVWRDPDFDGQRPTVYYVRALEIPTPRWSTIQSVKAGSPLPAGVPTTIQERGWSSPIWYAPPTSGSPAAVPALQRFKDPRPIVVAHRSCWQKATENSLASLQSCVRQGIDAAEIDIRTTKDGALILLHDAGLDRSTNLTGPVASHTLAELADAKLREGKGGPGSRLTDERIPTLSQALRFAKGRLILFIDTKCQGCDEAIKKEIEAEAAQDWVVFIGRMDNDYRSMSGWTKQQTIIWINDCKMQPDYPRMIPCFNKFVDGVNSFGADRPLLLMSVSREMGFYTQGLDAPEFRDVQAVVNPYIKYHPGITDEEILAQSKRQWDVYLKAASRAIIDDFPEEMLEHMRSLGMR